MAKKRLRGNGAGTVYPRKNKEGKIAGYRDSYVRQLQAIRRDHQADILEANQKKLKSTLTEIGKGKK